MENMKVIVKGIEAVVMVIEAVVKSISDAYRLTIFLDQIHVMENRAISNEWCI